MNKMKRKRNIAYVLMAVCLVMLTVAVFPHHHHFNFICLQHDVTACEQTCTGCCGEECCETTHHHSLPDKCGNGCITKFHCSVPSTGTEILPSFPFITLLYSIADILKLGMPDDSVNELIFTYIESLHGLAVQRAEGLRAPPCA